MTTRADHTNLEFQPLKSEYDRLGFVVVRQFLPLEELRQLQAQLERYIRDVVPGLADAHAFYQDRTRPETLKQLQHMGIDPYFEQYRRHPRWRALAETLIGTPADAQEPEWFNKPPGTEHPTPPHQDNFYFCLRPPDVVTLWLALDPIDERNGCLRYVAGSHRLGIRPHQPTAVLGFSQGIPDYGPDDAQREQAVALQPGDLLAHHCETIHRADPNRSTDRHRRAFALVFRGQHCQRDPAAFARYEQARAEQHRRMGLQVANGA